MSFFPSDQYTSNLPFSQPLSVHMCILYKLSCAEMMIETKEEGGGEINLHQMIPITKKGGGI
jgi:hypothetical protein